jgi:hypothetical protein
MPSVALHVIEFTHLGGFESLLLGHAVGRTVEHCRRDEVLLGVLKAYGAHPDPLGHFCPATSVRFSNAAEYRPAALQSFTKLCRSLNNIFLQVNGRFSYLMTREQCPTLPVRMAWS